MGWTGWAGRIVRSKLYRDASWLLGANVAAQAVGLLVYPLLTRLYGADDFGLLNLFLSIGGIIVFLATGQYEYAIVLPRSHRQGAWCLHGGLLLTAVVALLCVAALPFAAPIAGFFATPELARYLWLMPVYVAAVAMWTLLQYWLMRHRRFDSVSLYQIGQSTLSAGLKVGAGYGRVAGGLLYGSLLAPVVALAWRLWRMPQTLRLPLLRWEWRGVRAAAVRYRNFPMYALPKSLVDSLTASLPLLVMAPAFDLATVGFVGMALTLAYRPINIICSSLNQVLYRHVSEMVRQRRPAAALCGRYAMWALVLAVPAFGVLYIWLPVLCGWFLGSEWATTGEYIRLMLPWLLLVLLSNTLNFLPDVFGRQRGLFVFSLVRLVLQSGALYAGIAADDVTLTVSLFFNAGALVLAGQLAWFAVLIGRYERSRRGE